MNTINYKFAFISIIIAYFIAQSVVLYFNPELEKYIILLQILLFLIPIIIINENNNFSSQYKLNFKFSINVIPAILWALVGINLIEMGIEIVIKHILPNFLLQQYNFYYDNYFNSVNNLLINNSKNLFELGTITFCIAVVPAICEEFLFRGYLMQNIKQNNSKRFAIILSSLLFAIIHLNPIGFIQIFILGLYLGILFYTTRSIIPAILMHFLNNFITILSVNYYYGKQINITNIWFGSVILILGLIIMLLSIRTIKK